MKTLIIVGDDKLSGLAIKSIDFSFSDLHVVVDKSTNIKRLAKLICKGSLSVSLIFKMFLCELNRKGSAPSNDFNKIKSNNELLELIQALKPERIILFRAGLVINRQVIETNIPLLNIHCASVPDYAGLGSVNRALIDNQLNQYACLHIVTETIDGGDVIAQEQYELNPEISYCDNENIAYTAGIRLLKRVIHEDS